jgi:hypothetical protein
MISSDRAKEVHSDEWVGIHSADEQVGDDEVNLQDMKIYSHSSVGWVEDLVA